MESLQRTGHADLHIVPQGVLCIPVCNSSYSDCHGGCNLRLELHRTNRGKNGFTVDETVHDEHVTIELRAPYS